MASPYLASSLVDRFDVAVSLAGLLLAGFGLRGSGLQRHGSSGWLRFIGDLGILVLGGVASRAPPSWRSVSSQNLADLFVPLVVVLGMGYYTMHGTLQTRATEMAPESRGAAVSLFAFAFFMGQSAGPIVLGRILQARGYTAAFMTAGAGLAIMAVVARTLFARAAQTDGNGRAMMPET